ncbi:cell adhesion molecule 2-like [Gigantopelta aegis]|uniref:cell adhesion molecule 2-like n=1 Tax=Gigantopelta aegis TaxID=1735272 RepID=UPI001B88D502|nr:cell adhesion molecule 2-like [Gigantopelta aegis]
MEGIRFPTVWICFWIIFSIDIHVIDSIAIDLPPRLGVVGNNTVTLECRYTLANGESFSSVTWSRKRHSESGFSDIAEADGAGNSGYSQAGEDIKTRTNLNYTLGMYTIRYSDVQCTDEAKYRCTVTYFRDSSRLTANGEMDFSLEAAPLKPSSLNLTPDPDIFTENQVVEFTCSGNVGKPAGSFWWFVYHGNQEVNKTSEAVVNPPFSSSGPNTCTFVRTSKLTLNLTRADDGLVVRCHVYHPTQMAPTTAGNSQRCSLDSDLCLQSKRLVVHYPVREGDITAFTEPKGPNFLVDSMVTLKCSVTSNPPAVFTWENSDSNATFRGNVWTLNRLSLLDRGVYVCTAKNNVSDVMYNVSASVNVNVVETTTPPTTTPTTRSTTAPFGGRTDKTIVEPDDGKTTMIIIIVCVVVGIILIIVAVVVFIIIRRRKKKTQVEEPPEKPFNNHSNLSMYKTQPDLVSDEKKFAQNNSFDFKTDQDLAYSDLKFDPTPRSRKPVAFRESTDYAHVQMPAV